MTTAAEIEAAFAALPAADREPLLTRLERTHLESPELAPRLTPEQIALVNERVAALDRGEVELLSHEEVMAKLRATVETARRRQEGEALTDAA